MLLWNPSSNIVRVPPAKLTDCMRELDELFNDDDVSTFDQLLVCTNLSV